jgi:hypothetical protein
MNAVDIIGLSSIGLLLVLCSVMGILAIRGLIGILCDVERDIARKRAIERKRGIDWINDDD